MSLTVAVLGGSFDPVHDAHLTLARRCLEQVPCDEVWFMPADQAVHKPRGALASATHRRAMLELVLADEPALRLCTLELDRGRPMRSLRSVEQLRDT